MILLPPEEILNIYDNVSLENYYRSRYFFCQKIDASIAIAIPDRIVDGIDQYRRCIRKSNTLSDFSVNYPEEEIIRIQLESFTGMGDIYYNTGQYKEALDAYQSAYDVLNKKIYLQNKFPVDSKQYRDISTNYPINLNIGLGRIYYALGKFPISLIHYKFAFGDIHEIEISSELSLEQQYNKIYYFLGVGRILNYQKEYQQSIDFLEQALEIAKLLNDLQFQGRILGEKGNVYFSRNNYQEADRFYDLFHKKNFKRYFTRI